MNNFFTVLLLFFLAFYNCDKNAVANVNMPAPIDSRIKTLVYNPNEIFHVKFIVGYQSIIEFQQNEEIELISFGDPLPWSIKSITKRLFIKALDPDVKTNMTIITNKRTYLFEIESNSGDPNDIDDKMIYVLRFYYPDTDVDIPNVIKRSIKLNQKLPTVEKKKIEVETKTNFVKGNFNYSYSGVGTISPLKVFDDGKTTFFQFNDGVKPSIFAVNEDGREELLKDKMVGQYIAVDTLESQFSLRLDKELVCVFNDIFIEPYLNKVKKKK